MAILKKNIGQKERHIAILLKEKQRLTDEKYHRTKAQRKRSSRPQPNLTLDNLDIALQPKSMNGTLQNSQYSSNRSKTGSHMKMHSDFTVGKGNAKFKKQIESLKQKVRIYEQDLRSKDQIIGKLKKDKVHLTTRLRNKLR